MRSQKVACLIQEEFDLEVEVSFETKPKATEQGGVKMDLLTRNIQVTEMNKSMIPKEALIRRFNRIKLMMNKPDRPDMNELQREADIIASQLKILHAELITTADQGELDLPKLVREQYVPLVEVQLEEHRSMRARYKRLCEQLPHLYQGIEMPKITASYGNQSGVMARGGVYSPTEEAIFRPFAREERVREEIERLEEEMYNMELILERLHEDQREVIEARYMVRNKPTDEFVYAELGMGRQKYYKIKGAALLNIATCLGII